MSLKLDGDFKEVLKTKIKSSIDAQICIDCLAGFFDDGTEQTKFIKFCKEIGGLIMRKSILIVRGASKFPKTLADKDAFDSTIDITNENGVNIFHSERCSTIPSRLLFGKDQLKLHGILAPLKCKGIFTHSAQLGNHWILFSEQTEGQVKTTDDLTDAMVTFASIKANPSMDNSHKISGVCVHSSTFDSNGSEGCQTVWAEDYHPALDKICVIGEIVDFELKVDAGYNYPDWE